MLDKKTIWPRLSSCGGWRKKAKVNRHTPGQIQRNHNILQSGEPSFEVSVNICCHIKLLFDIYATSDEIPFFHGNICFMTLFTNARPSANSLVRNLSLNHILILSCHLCLGLSSGLYCLHPAGLSDAVFNRNNGFSSQQYFYCITLLYRDWLRAGRSGDWIPVGSRFFAPVQTGPGAHQASCTMGTGPFPGVKSGQGVTLTPHSLLVPWSWKSRAIPLLPLWAVRTVQSLSACTRVTFTFYLYYYA